MLAERLPFFARDLGYGVPNTQRDSAQPGAYPSMIVGTVVLIAFMLIDGVEANTPIYWGLGSSLVGSLQVNPVGRPLRVGSADRHRISPRCP